MLPERKVYQQPYVLKNPQLVIPDSDVFTNPKLDAKAGLVSSLQEAGLNEPIEQIQMRARKEIDLAYQKLKNAQVQVEDEDSQENSESNGNPVLKARRIIVMCEYFFEESPSIREYLERSNLSALKLWENRTYGGYYESYIFINSEGIHLHTNKATVKEPTLAFLQERHDFEFARPNYFEPICNVLEMLTTEDVYTKFCEAINLPLTPDEKAALYPKNETPPKKRWNPFRRR